MRHKWEEKSSDPAFFPGRERRWIQIPLMLFPSFTLTRLGAKRAFFCSCRFAELFQSNNFACKFSQMILPGPVPHGVDGRHQGGSCPAGFIPSLVLLVPSQDAEKPQWVVLQGQMMPVTPRTRRTENVYRQAWGFGLLLGLPGKIAWKTHPVQWNGRSRSKPHVSKLLKAGKAKLPV